MTFQVGAPATSTGTACDAALPAICAADAEPVSDEKAGAHVTAEIAVISPLAFAVAVTHAVALPNVPTFALTVTNVAADDPGPVAVTSPVSAVIATADPVTVSVPPDKFNPVPIATGDNKLAELPSRLPELVP
jgi:hypothetical protein